MDAGDCVRSLFLFLLEYSTAAQWDFSFFISLRRKTTSLSYACFRQDRQGGCIGLFKKVWEAQTLKSEGNVEWKSSYIHWQERLVRAPMGDELI
jgi:hypothetical protein